MRADLLRAPTPRPSGVHCRQEGDAHHVDALVSCMLRLVGESRIASWCIVDIFPLLKPYHWAAYAELAQIPNPSQAVIDAAIAKYRLLIQYPAEGVRMPELFAAF